MWPSFSPFLGGFLSTPSARRATPRKDRQRRRSPYFYPRPPRGGRPEVQLEGQTRSSEFLSTPSARRATAHFGDLSHDPTRYFYPRPPRGGRRQSLRDSGAGERDFYPRPPRGGRLDPIFPKLYPITISIHALREEGDISYNVGDELQQLRGAFLSTPSARRATRSGRNNGGQRVHFYPRPPRGGRLQLTNCTSAGHYQFLSTPSARRATQAAYRDA